MIAFQKTSRPQRKSLQIETAQLLLVPSNVTRPGLAGSDAAAAYGGDISPWRGNREA